VAVALLLALVAAGVTARLALMLAQRPAFTGFPDVGTYIDSARANDVFHDALRPAGYPLFLLLVHGVSAKLSVTILLQHALGVATALLFYAAVRRAGFNRFVALVPATVVLLSGSQIFLEHTPLSETLFTFLLAASVYAAARLNERASVPWALAAGLLAAVAGSVRVVGFALVPVLGLWIALAANARWRRRLIPAAACLAAGAAVVGVYAFANHEATGYTGITRAGAWNLYGRVGPFADCSKFTPPKGTRALCERTPPERRASPGSYVMSPEYSPGHKAFGGPFISSVKNDRKIGAFARAAILGQPIDYLQAVGRGMLKYVDPGQSTKPEGWTYTDFFHRVLLDPLWGDRVREGPLLWYGAAARGAYSNKRLLNWLLRYETATQLKGPVFVLLALLSLASLLLTRGRDRRAAVLFALVAWSSLVAPVATLWWSARYAVPAFGPLAASAGIGGWGVWSLVSRVKGRRATRAPAVTA
jgi:4-amino-4-deoxy-L-arabinose transferase-like glycosyltransferase